LIPRHLVLLMQWHARSVLICNSHWWLDRRRRVDAGAYFGGSGAVQAERGFGRRALSGMAIAQSIDAAGFRYQSQ